MIDQWSNFDDLYIRLIDLNVGERSSEFSPNF